MNYTNQYENREFSSSAKDARSEVITRQDTKWSQLPDVNKVLELGNGEKWFSELRDVLKKYGALDRFGITLLHKHFEIADDEIILETTDVKKRTLFMRPVKAADYLNQNDSSIISTSLRLVEGDDDVAVQTTMWSQKHNVDNRTTISDNDAKCFYELRKVLKEHDALDRYGIALLHRPFEVANDEILFETTDIEERTQIIRPVKTVDLNGMSMLTTSWKLVEGDVIATLRCVCGRDGSGHNGGHSGTI